ncbi:YozQ family protein [Heyndrickxia camelliae]|uniref:DUF4025 domain-containing protein n=1 Tax=Heyndrickxia camelliae TaxID=1707093 RepID=A0A2N3LQB6_9BACI|nr:YozQ family protein [Heyndrickxia camelliae]PKR86816.1 DUF4025 domain-containing protein [Heyndrickxia camelliae]
MSKNKNTQGHHSTQIAGKTYSPSDYLSNSDLSKGLAMTHEQVSDVYMEGTVDGVMENVEGEDIPLQQE